MSRFKRVFNRDDDDEDGMTNLTKVSLQRRAGMRPRDRTPSKLDAFLPKKGNNPAPPAEEPEEAEEASFQEEVLADLAGDDLIPDDEDEDDLTPVPGPEEISSPQQDRYDPEEPDEDSDDPFAVPEDPKRRQRNLRSSAAKNAAAAKVARNKAAAAATRRCLAVKPKASAASTRSNAAAKSSSAVRSSVPKATSTSAKSATAAPKPNLHDFVTPTKPARPTLSNPAALPSHSQKHVRFHDVVPQPGQHPAVYPGTRPGARPGIRPGPRPPPPPVTSSGDAATSPPDIYSRIEAAKQRMDVQMKQIQELEKVKEKEEKRRDFAKTALAPQPTQGTAGVKIFQATQMSKKDENMLYMRCKEELEVEVVRGFSNLLSKTTHLIVGDSSGAELRRTEKLLSAMAAGKVWIVPYSYMMTCLREKRFLPEQTADLGSRHFMGSNMPLYIPTWQTRQNQRSDGGVFSGWTVVIIADVETRKSYERVLAIGNAVVYPWTIDHLLQADNASLAKLTHIFIDPVFEVKKLDELYPRTLEFTNLSLVSYIYIEEFLTSVNVPDPASFSYIDTTDIHRQLRQTRKAYVPQQREREGSPAISADPTLVSAGLGLEPRCRPKPVPPPQDNNSPDIIDMDLSPAHVGNEEYFVQRGPYPGPSATVTSGSYRQQSNMAANAHTSAQPRGGISFRIDPNGTKWRPVNNAGQKSGPALPGYPNSQTVFNDKFKYPGAGPSATQTSASASVPKENTAMFHNENTMRFPNENNSRFPNENNSRFPNENNSRFPNENNTTFSNDNSLRTRSDIEILNQALAMAKTMSMRPTSPPAMSFHTPVTSDNFRQPFPSSKSNNNLNPSFADPRIRNNLNQSFTATSARNDLNQSFTATSARSDLNQSFTGPRLRTDLFEPFVAPRTSYDQDKGFAAWESSPSRPAPRPMYSPEPPRRIKLPLPPLVNEAGEGTEAGIFKEYDYVMPLMLQYVPVKRKSAATNRQSAPVDADLSRAIERMIKERSQPSATATRCDLNLSVANVTTSASASATATTSGYNEMVGVPYVPCAGRMNEDSVDALLRDARQSSNEFRPQRDPRLAATSDQNKAKKRRERERSPRYSSEEERHSRRSGERHSKRSDERRSRSKKSKKKRSRSRSRSPDRRSERRPERERNNRPRVEVVDLVDDDEEEVVALN